MEAQRKATGTIGLISVLLFVAAFLVFGSLNAEFSFANDFVSMLGAKGEPNALWWNLIGFVSVGALLLVFGISYGKLLKDKVVAILLSMFGFGFALISIPMDMESSADPVSKAHIVVTCFGLAFWLFGLSRMGYNIQLSKQVRTRANITATLLVSAMIGFVLGLWSMAITHRLVFGIVFGWTTITSLELLTLLRRKVINK